MGRFSLLDDNAYVVGFGGKTVLSDLRFYA